MNTRAKELHQTSEITWTPNAINQLIIDSIQDIKGKNTVKLDLRKLNDRPTDYFIICEADSHTQVKAISRNIQKRLKLEADTVASHVEGEREGNWVCMDYFYTMVHIFYRETRAFYELENLWSDAIMTEYALL